MYIHVRSVKNFRFTDIFPLDTFPPGHFPIRQFPNRQYPTRQYPTTTLSHSDIFSLGQNPTRTFSHPTFSHSDLFPPDNFPPRPIPTFPDYSLRRFPTWKIIFTLYEFPQDSSRFFSKSRNPVNPFQTSTQERHAHRRRKWEQTSPTLIRKRLKCDAYPSVWPGCPDYLTKPATTPRPTSLSSRESCRLNEEALRMEETIQDQFHSIGKLASKLDRTRLPVGLTEIKTEDYICFLNISLIEKPKVIDSFKITSDLQIVSGMRVET